MGCPAEGLAWVRLTVLSWCHRIPLVGREDMGRRLWKVGCAQMEGNTAAVDKQNGRWGRGWLRRGR